MDAYRGQCRSTRISNHTEPIPRIRSRRKSTRMLGNQELRILQYNVQKSRDIVLASLFQNPRVLEYDILAVQEPWRNPFIATTYHPLKTHFQLTYLDDPTTRVCLYINKRIDPGTWSVSHISKDIISVTIRNPHSNGHLHIFNVYNELSTDTLSILADTMAARGPDEDMIVLGDFNLHHPSGRQHTDEPAKGQALSHSSRSLKTPNSSSSQRREPRPTDGRTENLRST